MTRRLKGSGVTQAPAPSATRQIAMFAPMTSPKAITGTPLKEAVTPVANSSADPRCLAKTSTPQTISATPKMTSSPQAITTGTSLDI